MAKTRAPEDKKRILIVEDDETLGQALELKLLQAGFRVDRAHNGQEALQALDAATPDAIILDLFMPVMDGVDFLKELRVEREEKTPVVIFSGMESGILVDQCNALGISDYCVKGKTSFDSLITSLEKLF